METKIGEVRGFVIVYDTKDKLFHLRNADNEEVGSGKTQEEVEKQADTLAKQAYRFPISALIISGNRLELGKVTSINIEDKSVRFVYAEKGFYHSHTKVHLGHSNLQELTEHNEEITNQVKARWDKIAEIEDEVKALIDKLDKPINLAYFNLPGSY